MLRRILFGAALASVGYTGYNLVHRWRATWGIVPGDASRELPGDDLIATAKSSDTRSITIAATPQAIWPWLVQMGYGRGGWYSIDQLDVRGRSTDSIVDAWQKLDVGDIVPTHPSGGFEARIVELGRALVLYADPALMAAPPEKGTEAMPVGLRASSAFMSATPTEFAASWAFVLEPVDAEHTRLIERVRYWADEEKPVPNAALSILGFGVFVMMQRQMIGIRTRAERLAAISPRPEPEAIVEDRPTRHAARNGHATEIPETVIASA